MKKQNKQLMEYVYSHIQNIKVSVYKKTNGLPSQKHYEDICQSVFINTYESLSNHPEYITYDESGNIKNIYCLTTIINNKINDELRALKSINDKITESIDSDYKTDILSYSNNNNNKQFEDLIILKESFKKLKNKITEENYEIFKDYLKGFKYKELSEKYNKNIGTIKSRINRSMKLMINNEISMEQ